MKKYLLVNFILMYLTSCGSVTYHYITLKSNNAVFDTTKGLIFKQDSLDIYYSIIDGNKLSISLTNNTNDLLAVDWSKSFIIYNTQSFQLFQNVSEIAGVGILDTVTKITTFKIQNTNNPIAIQYFPPNCLLNKQITFPFDIKINVLTKDFEEYEEKITKWTSFYYNEYKGVIIKQFEVYLTVLKNNNNIVVKNSFEYDKYYKENRPYRKLKMVQKNNITIGWHEMGY